MTIFLIVVLVGLAAWAVYEMWTTVRINTRETVKLTPSGEPACTPAQAASIYAECLLDDAHEDELFYAFSDKCRREGVEYSMEGFFLYAGEHWRRPRDAYGYRKRYLESLEHGTCIHSDQ